MSSVVSEKVEEKRTLPEINLQEPFQPGSSPVHLLSRYMVIKNTEYLLFNLFDQLVTTVL